MKYVVRVDGSETIGGGHLMRCLSLVDGIKLTDSNAEVHLICCDLIYKFIDIIKSKGVTLHILPENDSVHVNKNNWEIDAKLTKEIIGTIGEIEWLIVDHYQIDKKWETELSEIVEKVLIIDDLADRKHSCDILLDQTYGIDKKRYNTLVSNDCSILVGTEYALLDKRYSFKANYISQLRDKRLIREKIFISLGASDQLNYSDLVLQQALDIDEVEHIYLVIGAANPHRKYLVNKYSGCPKVSLLYNLTAEEMIQSMLSCDIAIGAGGTSAWERCACGLPGLMIVMADNQLEIAKQLSTTGAIRICNEKNIASELNELLIKFRDEQKSYMDSVTSCLNICDGKGTARVLSVMEAYERNK
ncbi:UDP-2,4-diacetamido-2,4,6-trideoxy-beta-L-altropyranose hydrolase [Vibrio sp. 10N.261.52.C2]|uniref:UDP-2,4-diacetamido-2,4, 6-trideoxy-beta-L-altropyranose hydrolase n=1 Tax=Vibrio sp. 10N.261.52.C2 TaxID=3229681 RepID=UPI003551140D